MREGGREGRTSSSTPEDNSAGEEGATTQNLMVGQPAEEGAANHVDENHTLWEEGGRKVEEGRRGGLNGLLRPWTGGDEPHASI